MEVILPGGILSIRLIFLVISIDLNLAGMGSHHYACMIIRDCQKQLVYY